MLDTIYAIVEILIHSINFEDNLKVPQDTVK
jgi:hypothetical protein